MTLAYAGGTSPGCLNLRFDFFDCIQVNRNKYSLTHYPETNIQNNRDGICNTTLPTIFIYLAKQGITLSMSHLLSLSQSDESQVLIS